METTLAKNRSGFWEVRWSEEDPGTKIWRSKSVSTRTKNRKDAVAFRDAWIAGLKQDMTAAVAAAAALKVPTLAELIEDYIEHHVEANRKAKSQSQSLVFPKRMLGHMKADELDVKVITDYRLSRKRADGTLRRELLAIVAVLNWAVRKKMVSGDTVPQIDLPPEGQAKITYLDEDEETIFYAQAMGDSVGKKTLTRVTRFVALALDTAARKEAIESLTWDRVDLKNNLISFKDPLRHVTKKRRSEVPIPRRLRPLLERAFREKTNRYVVGGGDVKKAFLTWVATSCRPDIRAHDLRRTWATLSARAGVPLIDIADVLGDTMEVVMKHYRVFQPKHLQSAMDARWEE